jgi:phosphoglycerol transferase MdoB-like AlkP superfamily enzyme
MGTGDDFIRLIPQYLIDYWYMLLILIILLFIVKWLYDKVTKNVLTFKFTLSTSIIFLLNFTLGVGLIVLGARGGTQLRPITINTAALYTSAQNIPLVLNTPFSILTTIQAPKSSAHIYFNDVKVKEIYNPIQTINGKGKYEGRNIILIILESFSYEYIGGLNNTKGYTPFLDSLMKNSYVFTNGYSNGLVSIDALPSLFAGIPSLMNTPYILSQQSLNQLSTLPSELVKQGYQTSFYHGGTNGTMGFNAFCSIAGIQSYKGLKEYPFPDRDYDGSWGVYDLPYLQYYVDEINSMKKPFFSSVFTLSSHHPYTIPVKFKGVFPKGNLKVHETIGYTDYALNMFFKKAQKEDWYKNTLFVITADHPSKSKGKYFNNFSGKFHVPIIFYDPNKNLIGKSEKPAKQADIFATLLNMVSNDKKQIFSFGQDLFGDDKNYVVNMLNGIYTIKDNEYFLLFNGQQSIGLFQESDSLLKRNLLAPRFLNKKVLETKIKLEDYIKAYLQIYDHTLQNNIMQPSSYLKSEK